MICPRCLNEDPAFFYLGSRGWYCRRCIPFARVLIDDDVEGVDLSPIHEGASEYTLAYPLTSAQLEISKQCLANCLDSDVLIYAVCGSGKTEIVVETIAYALKHRLSIGFAIPRRQVVLELQKRLSEIFVHANVIAVCGGHTDVLDGDLIICTTHQLYRYYQKFDILILDEPDAFPFKGNPVLHGIAKTSCKGHLIYLTATPDDILLEKAKRNELKVFTLNKRPHGYPLPVPRVYVKPFLLRLFILLKWLKKRSQFPRMVFVPTIKMARQMSWFLNRFQHVYLCTSKTEDRDDVIQKFRDEKAGIMVCTTVMERGVTIPKVDVCVYCADDGVFDRASLIQMAGRAGRTFLCPIGEVIFILRKKSSCVDVCVNELKELNQHEM